MFTKPQDIVVALKLCVGNAAAPYAELGRELGMSASETHASVQRLAEARLVEPETRRVRREALADFLVHGVPYAFPASQKDVTRGIPTAWAAPVMEGKFDGGDQLAPVWPDPEGPIQGVSVKPLYPSVPHAAHADKKLYDLLALVDAIRIGRARERLWAGKEIRRKLAKNE